MKTPPKYPSTFHWPWSETVHCDDSYHPDPEFFLNKEVVVTEKLDGGNTALHCGEVFARSVLQPAGDGWFAMVKKHHSWKLDEAADFLTLYGEDIYGIHSIEYDAVPEDETYYLFAARYTIDENDEFCSWDGVKRYAEHYGFKTVPEVYRGTFSNLDEITKFFKSELKNPSSLGPTREGFVMRIADRFPAKEFHHNVVKYVRANHVQTDDHWRRNWQKCAIIGRK